VTVYELSIGTKIGDLEQRNGHYIALFHLIWQTCVPAQPPEPRRSVAEFMHQSVVFCGACILRCRLKESSRSISHLLIEFLVADLCRSRNFNF